MVASARCAVPKASITRRRMGQPSSAKFVAALLLALVAAGIFEHDDFTGLDVETAVNPVLDRRTSTPSSSDMRLATGPGVFGLEFAFGRAAEVRG